MMFPASELEWWSCYFSMDENPEKPVIQQNEISVEDSKKAFKDNWK